MNGFYSAMGGSNHHNNHHHHHQSAQSTAEQNGLTTVVPDDLKRLIRIVMRTFYGFELYLCMEMLMTYPCIKDEDLADILRLEPKQVQKNLVNLKKEKFVNERPLMATADGKQSKHNYYYINYKMMVNVIKYKLDKIRIQIESEEKQSTTRANFKCTNCAKTYSDLDTKDLFPFMKCLYCGHDVDEDASALPSLASRNLLAKFNTQMTIVFDLLTKVEHVRLADDILRPDPTDITLVLEKINSANGASGNGAGASNGDKGVGGGQSHGGRTAKSDMFGNIKWSDRTANSLDQTKIMINFDSEEGNSAGGGSLRRKELPSIIKMNQTTDESINDMIDSSAAAAAAAAHNEHKNRDSLLLDNIKKAANDTLNNAANSSNRSKLLLNDPNAAATGAAAVGQQASFLNSNLNNSSNSNFNNNNSAANKNTKTDLNSTGNLESIILQKLLIHEKKSSASSSSSSSLSTIEKKRDIHHESLHLGGGIVGDQLVVNNYRDEMDYQQHHHDFYSGDAGLYAAGDIIKKRKLNNGDAELQRDFNSMDESNASSIDSASNNTGGSGGVDLEKFGMLKIQGKSYSLSQVNPDLISKMNQHEKDIYINMCRLLYTELYENN